MPRLDPSLFRRASKLSPHLATLLPACRTIQSAQAELRWIRRHVLETFPEPAPPRPGISKRGARARRAGIARPGASSTTDQSSDSSRLRMDCVEDRIARLAARRGAGEPLQYVLGTQPFGDLEILCEKGVLIPRPETEAWASTLADLVFSSRNRVDGETRGEEEGGGLRILDLCSGTGCIGLLVHARGVAWRRRRMAREKEQGMTTGQSSVSRLFGFDVEPRAVRLARKNLRHNGGIVEDVEEMVTFEHADIFTDGWMASLDNNKDMSNCTDGHGDKQPSRRRIDVLVSNPPYISQRGFETDTGRNVRNYEPKLALVPSRSRSPSPTTCAPEDIFYARLLEIADTLRPRIAAFEVGDMAQAIRVVEMAIARCEHVDIGDSSQRVGGNELSTSWWEVLEIWRDWPDCHPSEVEEGVVVICGREVPVRGSGHGRVVFLSEGPVPLDSFTNSGSIRKVNTV